jgi:DNA-binding GntR family transcriptional regulator
MNLRTPSTLLPLRRATLADEVASQVRRAIISGEIPEGSPVSELQIAAHLEVSRVPVREALVELEHDGVVEFDHRGRCRVRQFHQEDFSEILSLRLSLEVMSARLAALHHAPADAVALEANTQALEQETDVTNISRLDVEFHDLIMQAAGHQRLLTCWRTVRTQFELLLAKAHRWQQAHDIPVTDHALRGHRPILKAILARRPEEASLAMKQHIEAWGTLNKALGVNFTEQLDINL